jgi:transposase
MCGLAVQLVNAAQAKNLPGRPKTDKLDAQWLARLTEMGLLRASFVPPKAIRDLRDYTRARTRLIQERTRCWQRLEKLLEGALVKDDMHRLRPLAAELGAKASARAAGDLPSSGA